MRLPPFLAIVVCGVLLASQLQATAAPPKKQDLQDRIDALTDALCVFFMLHRPKELPPKVCRSARYTVFVTSQTYAGDVGEVARGAPSATSWRLCSAWPSAKRSVRRRKARWIRDRTYDPEHSGGFEALKWLRIQISCSGISGGATIVAPFIVPTLEDEPLTRSLDRWSILRLSSPPPSNAHDSSPQRYAVPAFWSNLPSADRVGGRPGSHIGPRRRALGCRQCAGRHAPL